MQYKSHIDFKDYVDVVYRRYWILIQSVLIFTVVTAVYNFLIEPVYVTSAMLMIRNPSNPVGTGQSYQYDQGGINEKSTYLKLLTSPFIMRTAARATLRENSSISSEAVSRDEIVKKELEIASVMSRMQFTDIPHTKLISVSLTGSDPKKITEQINNISQIVVDYNFELNMKAMKKASSFIDDQLERTSTKLEMIEDQIKNYKLITMEVTAVSSKISELNAKTTGIDRRIEDLRLQLIGLDIKIEEYQKELNKISPDIENSVNISENPVYEKYKLDIGMKRMEFQGLSANYGIKHPSVRKVQHEIAYLEEELKNEIKQHVKSVTKEKNPYYTSVYEQLISTRIAKNIAEKQIANLESQRIGVSGKLQDLPDQELTLERLLREKEVTESLFKMMKQKKSESDIALNSKEKLLEFVSPALAPTYPIRPKKATNIMIAFIVGLGFGLVLVFVYEFFDQSIKNPVEIKENIPYSLLGVIPEITPNEALITEEMVFNPYLIMGYDLKSSASENIRALRTNITHMAEAGIVKKRLLITNSSKGQGKSFVLSNIAIALATVGKKVVMVDIDLRRAKLHLNFGIPNESGLTNILLGDDLRSNIQHTVFENLDVITSGPIPPNPSELISCPRLDEMLDALDEVYDYILIDSPPVTAVTDPQILATRVDGILFLVSLYADSLSQVMSGIELIKKVDGEIVGIICNRVKESGFYKNYYSYYRDYYSY